MQNTDMRAIGSQSSLTRRGFLRKAGEAALAMTVFPSNIPSSFLSRDGAVPPGNQVVESFL